MAIDKAIDSTQLDADLTSVANAIRTKGGTSASLAFPAGFVQAIGDIPSGGGTDYLALRLMNILTSYTSSDVTELVNRALSGMSNLTYLELPNCTSTNTDSCASCSSLATLKMSSLKWTNGNNGFNGCSSLVTLVLPSILTIHNSTFQGCSSLAVADLGFPGSETARIGGGSSFKSCSNLTTVIIRRTAGVVPLTNINVFDSTPFASGGTGGTLYVPSALISSYQADTNWSTILGYANNQIKSIESTHTDPNAPIDLTLYYADGTPIT